MKRYELQDSSGKNYLFEPGRYEVEREIDRLTTIEDGLTLLETEAVDRAVRHWCEVSKLTREQLDSLFKLVIRREHEGTTIRVVVELELRT